MLSQNLFLGCRCCLGELVWQQLTHILIWLGPSTWPWHGALVIYHIRPNVLGVFATVSLLISCFVVACSFLREKHTVIS